MDENPVESDKEDDLIKGHPTKKHLDQGTKLRCQEFHYKPQYRLTFHINNRIGHIMAKCQVFIYLNQLIIVCKMFDFYRNKVIVKLMSKEFMVNHLRLCML